MTEKPDGSVIKSDGTIVLSPQTRKAIVRSVTRLAVPSAFALAIASATLGFFINKWLFTEGKLEALTQAFKDINDLYKNAGSTIKDAESSLDRSKALSKAAEEILRALEAERKRIDALPRSQEQTEIVEKLKEYLLSKESGFSEKVVKDSQEELGRLRSELVGLRAAFLARRATLECDRSDATSPSLNPGPWAVARLPDALLNDPMIQVVGGGCDVYEGNGQIRVSRELQDEKTKKTIGWECQGGTNQVGINLRVKATVRYCRIVALQ